MLQDIEHKAKKQLENSFATENDGLSRHEKEKDSDLYGRWQS